MMIPIRCQTCGKPVGHLWGEYNTMLNKVKPQAALDKLGLERYCCRSLFLTHVDLVPKVGMFKR